MPHAPDLSGIALDGRYELHSLIGEGTFGRVYRGRDRRLARWVAVKVIKPWWAEDPEWVGAFEREAQLLASISDPGIVQIFDVGAAREGLYYVAELVDGESLQARLHTGPLPAAEACRVAEGVARALAGAHAQRIVHRDVKPANVLLAADGRIKVGDFGVARLAEGTGDAAVATGAGTPQYMAPEQADGGTVTPATDVYGIGVVLYEMLAGHPPFTGRSAVELARRHIHESPPPLPADVPALLSGVAEKALAKDPGDRYRDAGALARALAMVRSELEAEPGGIGDGAPADSLPRPSGATATLIRPQPRPRVTPHAHESQSATCLGDPLASRHNFNPPERRQRVAIVAVLLALVGGGVAAALLLTPSHLRLPNLRGMTKGAIRRKAHGMGFRTSFTSAYSSARRGTAMSQDPSPRTLVLSGSTVRVVLSAGPAPVTVPAVVGRPISDAENTLSGAKLRFIVTHVPAPGQTPGTVTAQSRRPGSSVAPGSTVTLSVAEAPQYRPLISFSGESSGQSVPFRIQGDHFQLVYSMSYRGTCTFILFCSGPSAKVTSTTTGATVDSFSLSEGSGKVENVRAGAGTYKVEVSPGDDTARWSVKVDDYY